MEQRKAGQRGKRANQYIAAFVTQKTCHADGFQLALLQQLCIGLTYNQTQTREERYNIHSKSHTEGVAPAIAQKLISRQAGVQKGKQCGRKNKAQWRTQLSNH